MIFTNRRKGESKDPLLETKVLLEEAVALRDDGHRIVDWAIRYKLRPVNGDPENYWKEGTWETDISSNLRSSLVHKPGFNQGMYD